MPAPFEKKDIPIEAKKQGPGPAAYNLPKQVGKNVQDPRKPYQPAYSFGSRHKDLNFKNPGSSYVGVHHVLTRNGKAGAPEYSMGGRFKSPKNKMADVPSPCSYNPNKPEVKRIVTIKAPHRYSHDNKLPGPQSYRMPAGIGLRDPMRKNGLSVSFGGKDNRFGVGSYVYDSSKTSGPAAYAAGNTDSFKPKAAHFSLSSRTNQYRDKTLKPGPGTYNVHKSTGSTRSGPKFSMGMKHSDYMMPFLTDVDI